tara:strand:+ start:27 stop:518 length:492 start_codon:yes stop_codon:yes gene_type:complete
MKLRSGFEKPSVPLCKCKKFWGSVNHRGLCSQCYNYGKNYNEKFNEKIKMYVDQNICKNQDLLYVIKWSSKQVNETMLINTIKELIRINKYITAKYAINLLRKNGLDTNKKSHIICSRIIDWWNITKKNGFNSTELCYFGNFGEGLIDFKFPPRKPNRCFLSI